MEYTKEQIENAITRWSSYLLESKMATEEEIQEMLGEGMFKHIKGAVGRMFNKISKGAKGIGNYIKTDFHDTFAMNDGIKQLFGAIDQLIKKGLDRKDLKGVKLYAIIDKDTYPILGFDMSRTLRNILICVVDIAQKGGKAMTLGDLLQFTRDKKISPAQFKNDIDGVVCAIKSSDQLLNESKLSDYIEKNKLSKEDALKPEKIKEIQELYGKNKKGKYNSYPKKIAQAIEKYFAKKEDATKDGEKTSKLSKKPALKEEPKEEPKETTKEQPKEEPKEEQKAPSATQFAEVGVPVETDSNTKVIVPKTKLISVKTATNAIGFKFDLPADVKKKIDKDDVMKQLFGV